MIAEWKESVAWLKRCTNYGSESTESLIGALKYFIKEYIKILPSDTFSLFSTVFVCLPSLPVSFSRLKHGGSVPHKLNDVHFRKPSDNSITSNTCAKQNYKATGERLQDGIDRSSDSSGSQHASKRNHSDTQFRHLDCSDFRLAELN